MPCNQLIADGKVVGHICRTGPMERKVIGRTKKKWCFGCRIHIVHDKVLYSEILRFTDKGELINGYYEPNYREECRKCHKDCTSFPGW